MGHPVFLELAVKVRPKWRRDEQLLERLGTLRRQCHTPWMAPTMTSATNW